MSSHTTNSNDPSSDQTGDDDIYCHQTFHVRHPEAVCKVKIIDGDVVSYELRNDEISRKLYMDEYNNYRPKKLRAAKEVISPEQRARLVAKVTIEHNRMIERIYDQFGEVTDMDLALNKILQAIETSSRKVDEVQFPKQHPYETKVH